MYISQRVREVEPAPIRKLWLEIPEGSDIISFGQGVPYFQPPDALFGNLAALMQDPATHRYAPDEGLHDLREALVKKLVGENGIELEEDWARRLIVTAGANQAFVNALAAIADPGDEVIIFSPYYFNHEMAIRLLDCVPVIVPTDHAFVPDMAALRQALTSRTRAIVTISPNNPTGAVYPERLLRAINTLCRDHGCWHISDETYEYFVYDGVHVSPGAFASASEHTISLFTFSKGFGMPGWRIGYMVIPPELYEEILKVQDTVVISANTAGQRLAMQALAIGKSHADKYLGQLRGYRERLLTLLEGYGAIAGGQGAFYLMPRFGAATDLTGIDLQHRLVRDHGVFTLPGECFGDAPSHCSLRLAFGNLDPETFEEGFARLETGLNAILR